MWRIVEWCVAVVDARWNVEWPAGVAVVAVVVDDERW